MGLFRKYLLMMLCFAPLALLHGQYFIAPVEGYSPQIGIMVDMLEELKDRVEAEVGELNQQQTDYRIDEEGNSIGALVMHIVATEAYTQVETLEGRSWDAEEAAFWNIGGALGDACREEIREKPI